ncbi:MAG: hypothetical protein UR28_C0016G0013 [Candidatus Peregrinibacteria bacterium GW2011_GWF2_33_10]|nr:MAG: hypothetical protein UR28_C0016G0013 [Candidatus Peregrinibacteria bacterium GW2011_GWF2_33_10]OGJ45839.1 MAG: hypothetical protein A2263_03545 [Candidatus Peregrinibacteria bacterium RIFOXYA2_FULL_33_21]OGJ46493.1 MAG: hypothetical protein A2272_03575 [Candidatus Peregrinibacteria bacterium RIFOXYA12_FULL_33_12]OGJ51370.1 MAG: hypothetical protein A2307_02355 [Candidatus Peregrinibacteria bacterium RIFOXYB2_FULL_33_20]
MFNSNDKKLRAFAQTDTDNILNRNRFRPKSSINRRSGKLLAIGTLFAMGLGGQCAYQHGTRQEIQACVKGLESRVHTNNTIHEGSDGRHYTTTDVSTQWIVATDQGTLQNSSAWLSGKFDSSEIQGDLKEGQKYLFKIYGWNIGFDRYYPNILEAQLIGSCDDKADDNLKK